MRRVFVLLLILSACGKNPDPVSSAPSTSDTRPFLTTARGTGRIVPAAESMAWFAEYLEARLPIRFRLRVVGDEEEYRRRIRAGEFDLVHLAPLEYVRVSEAVVPVALALRQDGSSYYHGAIVTRDTSIRTLEQIKGRRVTYVDEASASGFLYPLALLLKNGIDPRRDCAAFEPSGSHENVAINLAQGRYDVGFVLFNAESDFSPRMRGLNIIAISDSIPNGMFAFSRAFMERDSELAARLRAVLFDAAADSEGRAAFSAVFRGEGDRCAPASDANYDPVRETIAILRRHGYLP